MSLQSAIEEGLSEGLKGAVPSMVDTALKALWQNRWYPMFVGGQVRLMEAGMKPVEAWDLARKTIAEWAKDERAEFGDPRFGWDVAAGREIVEAYEIEHWEEA